MPARCSCSSCEPAARSAVAANSSTTGRKSGSSAPSSSTPCAAVAGLERGERGAAAAGLAVGPPGQVEAAAAPGVEDLDVVLRSRIGAVAAAVSRNAVEPFPRRPGGQRVDGGAHGGSSARAGRRRGTAGRPTLPAAPRACVRSTAGFIGGHSLRLGRRREHPGRAALAVPVEQVDPGAGLAGVGDSVAGLPVPQGVEGLHRHRRRAAGALAERAAADHAGAAVDVEAAAELLELVGLAA